MEFLQALLPSPHLLRLESYAIESSDCLLLNLSSTQTIVPCPLCGGLTHRIHSHYERTPENRQAEDTDLLEQLVKQHSDLTLLVELADEFLQLVRKRQADALNDWLLKATSSSIKPLQTFAKGLFDDYAAVKASMCTEWSNGPVEGLNNKLKMLKRQMYGRAGLGLLAKRLIMAT